MNGKIIKRILNLVLTIVATGAASLITGPFGPVVAVGIALYLIGYRYAIKGKAPYFEIFK